MATAYSGDGPLAQYDSLQDPNLNHYFVNRRVQRHLLKSGLVTDDGLVVDHEAYRVRLARLDQEKSSKQVLGKTVVEQTKDMERKRRYEIHKRMEDISKLELVRRVKSGHTGVGRGPALGPGSSRGIRSATRASGRRGRRHGDELSSTSSATSLDDELLRRPQSHQLRTRQAYLSQGGRSGDGHSTDVQNIDTHQLYEATSNPSITQFNSRQMPLLTRGADTPYRNALPTDVYFTPPLEPSVAKWLSTFEPGDPPPPGVSYLEMPEGNEKIRRRARTTRASSDRLSKTPPKPLEKMTPELLYRRTEIHSLVNVTLRFLGRSLKLEGPVRALPPHVEVMQQHCGGNTLCRYRGHVHPQDKFLIVSRRHKGMPFGLSVYLDSILVLRISTCCEYSHRPGRRLGGPKGHFRVVSVKGGEPCLSCRRAEFQRSASGYEPGGLERAESVEPNTPKDWPPDGPLPGYPSPGDGDYEDEDDENYRDTRLSSLGLDLPQDGDDDDDEEGDVKRESNDRPTTPAREDNRYYSDDSAASDRSVRRGEHGRDSDRSVRRGEHGRDSDRNGRRGEHGRDSDRSVRRGEHGRDSDCNGRHGEHGRDSDQSARSSSSKRSSGAAAGESSASDTDSDSSSHARKSPASASSGGESSGTDSSVSRGFVSDVESPQTKPKVTARSRSTSGDKANAGSRQPSQEKRSEDEGEATRSDDGRVAEKSALSAQSEAARSGGEEPSENVGSGAADGDGASQRSAQSTDRTTPEVAESSAEPSENTSENAAGEEHAPLDFTYLPGYTDNALYRALFPGAPSENTWETAEDLEKSSLNSAEKAVYLATFPGVAENNTINALYLATLSENAQTNGGIDDVAGVDREAREQEEEVSSTPGARAEEEPAASGLPDTDQTESTEQGDSSNEPTSGGAEEVGETPPTTKTNVTEKDSRDEVPQETEETREGDRQEPHPPPGDQDVSTEQSKPDAESGEATAPEAAAPEATAPEGTAPEATAPEGETTEDTSKVSEAGMTAGELTSYGTLGEQDETLEEDEEDDVVADPKKKAQRLAREESVHLDDHVVGVRPERKKSAKSFAPNVKGKAALDFVNVDLSDEQLEEVCTGIEQSSTLSSVVFRNTLLDDRRIARLAPSLAKAAPNLKMLNFNLNKIGPAGAEHISNTIKSASSLQMLLLHGNPIGDSAVESLVDSLLGGGKTSSDDAAPVIEPAIRDTDQAAAPVLESTKVADLSDETSAEQQDNDKGAEAAAGNDTQQGAEGGKDDITTGERSANTKEKSASADIEEESGGSAVAVTTEETTASEHERTGDPADAASAAATVSVLVTPPSRPTSGGGKTEAAQDKAAKSSGGPPADTVAESAGEESGTPPGPASNAEEPASRPSAATLESSFEEDRGQKEAAAKQVSKARGVAVPLAILDLGDCDLSDKSAASISRLVAESTTLSDLNLSGNCFSAGAMKGIGEALAKSTSLRALSLDYCGIGDAGMQALAEGLSQNKSVVTLDLESTGLSDNAVEHLLQVLLQNKSLETINLSRNSISTACWQRVKQTLAKRTRRKSISY